MGRGTNTWVKVSSLIVEVENALKGLSKNEVGEDFTPQMECGIIKVRDGEINWSCLLRVKVTSRLRYKSSTSKFQNESAILEE